MLTQAIDFRDESRALHALLAPLDDAAFVQATRFKDWTLNDIVAHLDQFNRLADDAREDEARYEANRGEITRLMETGLDMRSATERIYGDLRGRALLERWREGFERIGERWVDVDPKRRLPWFGPSMSARSSMTARLMETWAHGQAAYDLLGVERVEDDRIGNIVVLGVNTFGWTFSNRGLPVPEAMPQLVLTSPSGQTWTHGGSGEAGRIEGAAHEFCQVVTQVRNVADTSLRVTGETAIRWMAVAQCFAGPPVDPPAPGSAAAP